MDNNHKEALSTLLQIGGGLMEKLKLMTIVGTRPEI